MANRSTCAAVAVLLAVGLLSCRPPKKEGPDVPALVAKLQSPDAAVSGPASVELLALGEPAVEPVAALLRSDEARVRRTAATTLWGLGPKARPAVPALSATLADPDAGVRAASAMALEAVGPGAEPAVPALITALKDEDGQVRQWAAKALGAVGPPASAAVPALREAARIEAIRPAAEEAIARIEGRSRPSPPAAAP